mmetsp:Transcript_9491/g.14290  ORF Transcript_9491/g.14290 Transcript_9491/m.14290 type:complete len:211 (+) Transcript_9491:81-713(+)
MSKKKKGLSAEEKRQIILDIYHSQKEPFNLKEIENLASKRGVVQQTIKDQNQSLVDDSLVHCDKIGSSNFFWSFPIQAYHENALKVTALEESIKSAKSNCETEEVKIKELQAVRCATDRASKLEKLKRLRDELHEVDVQISKRSANDPEEVKRITSQAEINHQSADRWTENIWSVKKYLCKKKGMAGKEVDRLLGIDGSFDYLSYIPSVK